MKKLLSLFPILLFGLISLAQSPPLQIPRSSATNIPVDYNIFTKTRFKIPTYPDTLRASINPDSLGLIIYTKTPNLFWYRDTVLGVSGIHKWTALTAGSGSGSNNPCYKLLAGGLVDTSLSHPGTNHVSPSNYIINCKYYEILDTTWLTIPDPCPAGQGRFITYYVDTNGVAGQLIGECAENPIKEQVDSVSQIELTFIGQFTDADGTPAIVVPNYIFWGDHNKGIIRGEIEFRYDSIDVQVYINIPFQEFPAGTKLAVKGNVLVDGDIYMHISDANNRRMHFGHQFMGTQNSLAQFSFDANRRSFNFGGVNSSLNFNTNNGVNYFGIWDYNQSAEPYFGTEQPYIFNVASSRKGVLLPRLTTAQMVASTSIFSSAPAGLLCYNTDTSGYCYYNGSVWRKIDTDTDLSGTVVNNSASLGVDIDTLKTHFANGTITDFYYVESKNIIKGGFIVPTGVEREYYASTVTYARIGTAECSAPATTITLDPLDDPDLKRIDVIVFSATDCAFKVLKGVEAENPSAQTVGLDEIYRSQVLLSTDAPSGITNTILVYNEAAADPTEFGNRSATGVTVTFNNAGNAWDGATSINVGAINNNDIIGLGTDVPRTVNPAGSITGFIKLKQSMPNSNGMTLSFYNNGVAVSAEVGIPFNRADLNYQGFGIPLSLFSLTSSLVDSVRLRYSGGGAGISGFYLDYINLIEGVSPGGSGDANLKYVRPGTLVTVDSLTFSHTYVVSVDTSSSNGAATKDYVQNWLANYQAAGNYMTGTTGDVVSTGPGTVDAQIQPNVVGNAELRQGAANSLVGRSGNTIGNVDDIVASTPKTVAGYNGTIVAFASLDSSWLPSGFHTYDYLATMFQQMLNGTGYVKMSGTTPSYVTLIPVADGGTGTSTPSLVAGTNISITGSWPNQTINSTGGGGMTNPMTTNGDMIYQSAGIPARLPIGTTGQSLQVIGGVPTWNTVTSYINYIPASKSAVSTDAGNGGTGTNGGSNANARNVFVMEQSGNAVTTGIGNFAFGFRTLRNITDADYNMALGYNALAGFTTQASSTANRGNIAFGYNALTRFVGTTSTLPNIAIGAFAMDTLLTGGGNLAIGTRAMQYISNVNSSVAVGYNALSHNSVLMPLGTGITAVGFEAGANWSGSGNNNTFIGYRTGYLQTSVSSASDNTFIGAGTASATTITTASNNIFMGGGNSLTSGLRNVSIGSNGGTVSSGANNLILAPGFAPSSGSYPTSGSNNIALGDRATLASATTNNQLNIGNHVVGNGSGSYEWNGTNTAGGISYLPTFATSAMMNFNSTTKGLLTPRMTTTQRNAIGSPATGLFVYDNTVNFFSYYNGTAWKYLNIADSVMFRYTGTTTRNFVSLGAGNVPGFAAGTVATGRNIAIGDSAMLKITTGGSNIAIGYAALRDNTTFSNNIAIGPSALLVHNGTAGSNVAIGASALIANTAGYSNTAIGVSAMHNNAAGYQNVSVGQASTTGGSGITSVAVGYVAVTAGTNSTAVGANSTLTGDNNVAVGANTGGWSSNSALIGPYAGRGLYAAEGNTAVGMYALGTTGALSISANYNTAIGYRAMGEQASGFTGTYNVAVGVATRVPNMNSNGQGNYQNVLYIANGYQSTTVSATPTTNGQVSIGINAAAASAVLDVTSTTKGFLPPRMTATQAEAIGSPAEGLMIYSTDGAGSVITSKGWWGYDGSTWVKLN